MSNGYVSSIGSSSCQIHRACVIALQVCAAVFELPNMYDYDFRLGQPFTTATDAMHDAQNPTSGRSMMLWNAASDLF